MLGVLRRRWKPKRNSGGRKNKDKDKCATDGSSDLSVSPRESRSSRAVRDTRQVHPEKESDKIGVLGRDYQVLSSAGQKDGAATKGGDPVKDALLSPAQLLKEYQKDCLLSPSSLPPTAGVKHSSSCKDIKAELSCEFLDNSKDGGKPHSRDSSGHHQRAKESAWSEKKIPLDSCDDAPAGKEDLAEVKRDGSSEANSDSVSPLLDNHLNEFLRVTRKDTWKSDAGDSNELCDDDQEEADATPNSSSDADDSEGEKEKMDAVKESLEAQIAELKRQLEEQKEQLRKEQAALAQLQLETSSQVRLREDLERERLLRIDAEARLREVRLESEHCKARSANLQEDFHKMEEMVCNMLQFKLRIDRLRHEKSSLALAYENQIRKYESCIESLEKENFMLMNELKTLEATNKEREEEHERSLSLILMERMKLLEQENASLVVENEQQRQQYERCLDDVANQVVQALLAQKNLKEECVKLQRKVQDLEHQNRALTVMFKQRFLHTADCAVSCGKDRMQHLWATTHDPKSPEDDFGQDFASELGNVRCMSPLGGGGQRACPSNGQRNRQPGHDSPEPTSQSEDSTESLASMCSDYSFNSGSSGGNLMSQPGLPKMSSPPQWLRDRIYASGDVPVTALASKLLLTGIQHRYYRSSASKWGSKAGSAARPKLKVPRSELFGGRNANDRDFCSKDELCGFSLEEICAEKHGNDPTHCRASADLPGGRTRRQGSCVNEGARQMRHHNVERLLVQDKDFASSRSTGIDSINGLDSVETPSDECFSLDGMPILGAMQKHFGKETNRSLASETKVCSADSNCNFASHPKTPADTSKILRSSHISSSCGVDGNVLGKHLPHIPNLPNVSLLACSASLVQDAQAAASSNNFVRNGINAPRPTTLNVVPHVMGDPMRNFCFPSLELRSRATNPCGNVYEEMDKPLFPLAADDPGKNAAATNPSKQHRGATFIRDDSNTVISKRKEIQKQSKISSNCEEEFTTSTVVRRLPGGQGGVSRTSESTQQAHSSSSGKHSTEMNKTACTLLDDQANYCNITGSKIQGHHHHHHSSTNSIQARENICQTYRVSTHLEISSSPLLENESPLSAGDGVEHGNKDEGYSTMSSDVQSELVAIGGACGSVRDLPGNQHSPVCIVPVEPTCKNRPARSDFHEGCMSSSSDSGLGLQRCILESRRSAAEGEDSWCTGFECDLDSSVVRKDARNIQKLATSVGETKTDESAESKSDDQLTRSSSLADASVETTVKVGESQTIEDLVGSLGLQTQKKRVSSDPSYDKLLLLLAPQGFKPCRRESRRVTLPLVHTPISNQFSSYLTARKVETAEKATITDLDEKTENYKVPVRKMLDASTLASDISEKSTETEVERMCSIVSDSFAFIGNAEGPDLFPCHTCSTYHKNSHLPCESRLAVERRSKKAWSETVDCENASCPRSMSQSRWPQRRSMFLLPGVREAEEVQVLQRASSDSHLFLGGVVHRRCSRCTSLATSTELHRAEVHLGILPLEVHNSACELSSHSLAASTTITPPLRRSKRQVLVEQPDAPVQWLGSDGGPHSPTVSLSSVRTSASEEGSVEEDEELGAISLKCSRDRDISSESDNERELLEHRNLVEKWLQGGAELCQEQKPHSYDDEEVGNWSFQLIKEDEGQSDPKKSGNEARQDQWSESKSSTNVHCKRSVALRELERIEETGLEEDYQDDFWGNPYWEVNKSNLEEGEKLEEPLQKNRDAQDANVSSATDEKAEDENRPNGESRDVASTNERDFAICQLAIDNSVSDVTGVVDRAFVKDGAISKSTENLSSFVGDTEKADAIPDVMSTSDGGCSAGHLSAETKEFKRDFYRLCAIGSSKSLIVSESESMVEQEVLRQSLSSPVISPFFCGAEETKNVVQEEKQDAETKEKDEIETLQSETIPVDSLTSTEPATLPDVSVNFMPPDEINSIVEEQEEDNSKKLLVSCCPTEQEAKLESSEMSSTSTPPCAVRKREKRIRKPSISGISAVVESGRAAGSEKTKIPVSTPSAISESSSKSRKHSHRSSSSKASSQAEAGSRRKPHRDDRSQSSSQKLPEKHRELRERPPRKSSLQSQDQGNSCRKVSSSISSSNDGRVSSKLIHRVNSSKSESSKKHALHEHRKMPKSEVTESESIKKLELHAEVLSVDDLERKFSEKGEGMSVADKIHELNAFLSRSKTSLNLLDSWKCDVALTVVSDNAEAQDSSLERKKTIQKKEKALSEVSGNKEGCGTSWVHLEADIDLSDPKARANLLDSMMASSSSSGSEDEEGDGDVMEHQYHQRLHAIHRIRRHRKRATDRDAVISFIPRIRASIIDRQDFYCRFGEKEKEAVACFDFLEDLSTSPSDGDPSEGQPQAEAATASLPASATANDNNNLAATDSNPNDNTRADVPSANESFRNQRYSLDESVLYATNCRATDDGCLFSTTTFSQDAADTVDHISLSDSCAESYTSSTQSLNHIN